MSQALTGESVAVEPADPTPDYAQLAELLTALAYPVRLDLLDNLRVPRTLGEIRVAPRRRDADANPDRPASRVTVLGHLEKLVEVGLVTKGTVQQRGRPVPIYAVNASRLYALMETLRRLGVVFAGQGTGPEHTGTLTGAAPEGTRGGPRLVLVHGVYEGKSFPLAPGTATSGRWVVGREAGIAVTLDYDPYVSQHNAELWLEGGEYRIRDLGSKNGTSVNWAPIGKDPVTLQPGDIVGVGWSRLTFAVA